MVQVEHSVGCWYSIIIPPMASGFTVVQVKNEAQSREVTQPRSLS